MDYDYVIIGSGFGGSVSALRLVEKGYRVLVVERGKRYRASDFPKTNWDVRKYLWAPKLFCYGIQAITFLRDVLVLHGAGVGGGSLVYANTLLVPPDAVFEQPAWKRMGNWRTDLAPHYATAKRMLGVTKVPAAALGETDRLLRDIAHEMGRGGTFHATEVGVYFGEAGKTVADPYFDGEGPERTGCTLCGGCMVGCRHGAKNTLDKNYLYLAEKGGATILPETEVVDVREVPGGYAVGARGVTGLRRRWSWRARGVVFAGGVLGTLPLLFRCKARGSLARLSPVLGQRVLTNSEALLGATSNQDVNYAKGIAIASGFNPDDDTHIEMVRYGPGQDFMALLATTLTPGGPGMPRWLRWVVSIAREPRRWLRHVSPMGFAKRSGILLVMQPLESFMRLRWARRWWWPGARLQSDLNTDQRVPKYFPVAHEVAERLADKVGGDARSVLPEVLFNLTSTAHILGGCPMGEGPETGVIDRTARVYGYDNLFVIDGSIMPANLSVNPSLTITALAEWAMSHVEPRP
jgi:cholesterol oxidase